MVLDESLDPLDLDDDENFHAGCCDKFGGHQVTARSSDQATCKVCRNDMEFFGQVSNGVENWFIAIVKICPSGHAASLQMIRG